MRSRLLTALAIVAAAAAYGAQALASADEQQAHGALRSQVLAAPACTSPVGICTAGRLTGTINGDFVFTATSLQPTSTPGVLFYTGEIIVHTSRGDVRCQDAGAFQAAAPGGVADICTVTGGTGDWVGVAGHLRIHGTFTFAEGGNSHYEGVITH